MTTVSIIGAGTMGQAIAELVSRGGHTAEMIGHEDAGKAVTGDVVVLSVPYPALSSIVSERGSSLAGKVIVDITNPIDFETFDSLTVPAAPADAESPSAQSATGPRTEGKPGHKNFLSRLLGR